MSNWTLCTWTLLQSWTLHDWTFYDWTIALATLFTWSFVASVALEEIGAWVRRRLAARREEDTP